MHGFSPREREQELAELKNFRENMEAKDAARQWTNQLLVSPGFKDLVDDIQAIRQADARSDIMRTDEQPE